jgi:hypothetical protein
MDLNGVVRYLGHTADSAEVTALLNDLGVTKTPRLKRGELYEYVQLPKKGLVLAFEASQEPKTSKLMLTAVQVYSSAEKGFTNYGGALPEGIKFSDGREDVRQRLGSPTESDGREDTWERKGYNLIVQYTTDESAVQMLHLALPVE